MSRFSTVRKTITGLGLAILGTACSSENLTSPDASASRNLTVMAERGAPTPPPPGGLKGPETVPVLQRHSPLSHDVTVTKVIDIKGGEVDIGSAGLKVTFLPGAVLQKTTITITAYAGSNLAYSFGPHGITFLAPVIVTQDLKQTNVKGLGLDLYGAYVPDDQGGIAGGLANITELLPAITSYGIDLSNLKLEPDKTYFVIQHFSGYILTGARGSAAQ